MIRVGIALCLLLSTIYARSDGIFIRSEAESQYQLAVESAIYEGLLEKGLLESAIQDQSKGLSLTETKLFLRESARITSICNILGMRLYKPDFKARVGELISEGADYISVKQGVEKLLGDKLRTGEIDEKSPFKPIIAGVEFSKECLKAIKENPIPSYSGVSATLEVPEGYALDAKNGRIYFKGQLAYQEPESRIWNFTCLEMEGRLRRPLGTTGISGSERMFPTPCEYQRSLYYGDSMKYVAWAPPQNNSVSFVMSNGPGGSSANIDYKIVTLDSGVVVSKSKLFHSGEYFRALITKKCSALFNEYDTSEHITLGGTCSDIKLLIQRTSNL